MLLGEAKRKAPAQPELRPTCAWASRVNPSIAPNPLCDLRDLCAMFCPLPLIGNEVAPLITVEWGPDRPPLATPPVQLNCALQQPRDACGNNDGSDARDAPPPHFSRVRQRRCQP
jgi:hypothetical protein